MLALGKLGKPSYTGATPHIVAKVRYATLTHDGGVTNLK